MIEITIHGRGGQGGVTLAKLIAEAYFLRGKHAQAFGVYAAERSGAPVQAFVRIDDEDITNHNQIREPDHVIVLDRTLIGARITAGLKEDGWIILNSPEDPEAFVAALPGRRVATVDATTIAAENGLGTRAVPIVNTTMLGAVLRALELPFETAKDALSALQFGGGNIVAARQAFDGARFARLPGVAAPAPAAAMPEVAHFLDPSVGRPPAIRTGSWATSRPDRRRLTSPCSASCPAGNDIQAFVAAVGHGHHDEALGVLLETSPFPGVCGRVCPAPCMESCNRHSFDESVNIRELERYVADRGRRPRIESKPQRESKVAVVGSGPAGLSAAYHLARLGYPVTVLEAGWELGGMMRTGIPEYRLPRTVLDREIDFILEHGVEPLLGCRVRRTELLELSHRYAAVFVATGLQEARTLELGVGRGVSPDRVMQGLDFLDRARCGLLRLHRDHVVVVGGGNTAVDAARSARRLGARSVQIVYRRTRDEMPAIREEVDAAIEEGITLHELAAPVRLSNNGAMMLLTCRRMKLGEPDESGRRRPIMETSEDSAFDLRCDRVVLALGQSSDLSILPEGSSIRSGEALLGLAGSPLFCGGDFATNDGTVAAAIGNGRRAALHIHRTLTGEDLFPPPAEPVAGPEVMRTHVFTHSPASRTGVIPLTRRRTSFAEVHTGLTDDPQGLAAVTEAQRCFSCGVCNQCDRCATWCPEGILERDGNEYRFHYDYCKGCGVCAAQCPRGVIYMTEL